MGVKFGVESECFVEFFEGREELMEERWELSDDFRYRVGAREWIGLD
jgi:hypothetical protein